MRPTSYRSPSDVFLKENYGRRFMAILAEDRLFEEIMRQHLAHNDYNAIGVAIEKALFETLHVPNSKEEETLEGDDMAQKRVLDVIDKIKQSVIDRYKTNIISMEDHKNG